MKRDVSVLIASRNEEFLSRTVEGVLKNKRANTDVIIVADGDWPNPPVKDHPDVLLVYHPESVGQRAAINEAAKLSNAKFIMKLDAHCIMDEGFDVKLMKDCEYDWTVVPRLYNLHVFDWKCKKCGNRWYQGPTPRFCCKDKEGKQKNEGCDSTDFERIIVWEPRWNRKSDFMRFDNELHFQYWGALGKRPESQGDIADTMSLLGACFFTHRQRYWDLGGSDEEHGSWGQQGTEIACKSWLSGGRLVVNKKTWYSHMFRTQGGDFGFPYPLSGRQVEGARTRSKELFKEGKWDKAIHPLSWLIEKFWPVPGWTQEDLIALKKQSGEEIITKGIIYYTDNQLNLKIAHACKKQLKKIGLPIVSSSLKPMDFGKNVYLPLKRGYLTLFKQILATLEASDSDIVFFAEHDVLYHPSHFNFTPPTKDKFYYNQNVWRLRTTDGFAVHYDCNQLSGLCCYRELAIQHYKELIAKIEKDGWDRRMGFEPGTHDNRWEGWKSEQPNVDIRHGKNLTLSKWSPADFRNKKYCINWQESYKIPFWGKVEFALK